jgi:hypothetical protein
MKNTHILFSNSILVLAAALAFNASAQQQPPPPAPPPGGYDVNTLQNMHPTRPGYRHTVTQYSANYYNYIADKRARGEPLTNADRNGIALLISNRTWPVPPQVTEADRNLSDWIDRNHTYTSRGIVIGTHSASGRIDYDADSAAVERFRQYYYTIPPGQRSTVANMMAAYYRTLGFDMRSDRQRAADDARENPPREPTAAETAAAERERDNAERTAQYEKDREYFEGQRAIERLKEKIKESKQEEGGQYVPDPDPGSDGRLTGGNPVAPGGEYIPGSDSGSGGSLSGGNSGDSGGTYVPGSGSGGHMIGGSDSIPPGGDTSGGGSSGGGCDGGGSCGQ